MAKLNLSDLTNITGAETTAIGSINATWAAIEAAIENTVSRDGTTPNTMSADFDLNDNDLLNVRTINGVDPNALAGTMTVGTVTTGAEGSAVTFTNVGTTQNAIWNISIPVGVTGNRGPSGDVNFANTAALQADTDLTLTTGTDDSVVVGDKVQVALGSERYSVVAAGSIDYDQQTAGGVKLKYDKEFTRYQGFGPLGNTSYTAFTASASHPKVTTSFSGVLYGTFGTNLYQKTTKAGSWSLVTALPAEAVHLIPMSDGEVVLVTASTIYKSSGWGGTVTWNSKVTSSGGSAVFLKYSTAGSDGVKMIVGEYATGGAGAGWEDSKKAWATQDSGDTWSEVYDAETLYPTDFDDSHIHGCCYDPEMDLFFVIEGHTTSMGIRYSADPFTDATDWTRIEKGTLGATRTEGQPTTIVPAEHGIVLASDTDEQGIWVIRRADDPTDLSVEMLYELPLGRGGILGFGQSHAVDRKTGVVYFGYQFNEVADVVNPLQLYAADGASGGTVWTGELSTIPSGSANIILNIAVAPWGEVIAQTTSGSSVGQQEIKGDTAPGTIGLNYNMDPGGVLGGTRQGQDGRATAVGAGSTATGERGLSVGAGSEATQDDTTAMGIKAKATHTQATVIGSGAESAGNAATAIGYNVKANTNSVVITANEDYSSLANLLAIGHTQTVSQTGVALGTSVTLSGIRGVVAGTFSTISAAAADSVVFGHNSHAAHTTSSVLGYGLTTTAGNQVKLGAQHIEMENVSSDPAAPADGFNRLFFRENGSSKQELCVQFPTGSAIVIATEV